MMVETQLISQRSDMFFHQTCIKPVVSGWYGSMGGKDAGSRDITQSIIE
jgi:hypothetical protein